MSGLTTEEALGQGWKESLHSEDQERIFSSWYEAAQANKNWELEYRFVNINTGESTWVKGLAKPLFDEKNAPLGYVGFNIDVSRERAIRERKEKQLKREIHYAHEQLELLQGILPICSGCKKIHDANDNWLDIEQYITNNTEAILSHGICPDCIEKYYPNISQDESIHA